MSREILNLRQAAEHVHLEPNLLRHSAQRGEIEATERGGDWFFEHRALDEWAQRNLLASAPRDLDHQHRAMMDEDRRVRHAVSSASGLFQVETIDLALASKTKAGAIRDMTDLAVRGGLVYDPDALHRELVAREEAASTAIGGGVALLHPRFHDPYLFEASFVAYARSARGVFFGSDDGEPTRHFFLVCATDHELHLHILARLAVLARDTDLVTRLEAAETPDDVLAALAACEAAFTETDRAR